MAGPSPRGTKEGRVAKWAKDIDTIHLHVLRALKEGEPLVVLASLSLVVATFSSNVTGEAVSFAVAASMAFMAGLLLSVAFPPGVKTNPVDRLQYSGAALVAIGVGFIMLFLVGLEIAGKYPPASRVVSVVVYSFGALAQTGGALVSLERISRFRETHQEGWQRRGLRLQISSYIMRTSLAAYLAIGIIWFFWPILPFWLFLTPAGILIGFGLYVRYSIRRG